MVTTFVRFSRFARSKIVGKAEEGASLKKTRKTVLKRDGRRGSERAIKGIIANARADPDWEGEDSAAGGRPQELSASEQKALKKLMEDEVGVARVTIVENCSFFEAREQGVRKVVLTSSRACVAAASW